MSKSGIKFIGTGSGKASIKRYHSSLLISSNNYRLLVDAGDGISRALLEQRISYSKINGILITHLHPDHFAGLASLIVQMNLTGRKKNLEIFIHQDLKQAVEDFLYHSYLFRKRMRFNLELIPIIYEEDYKINPSFSFKIKENSHLHKYIKYADERKISFSSSSILFKIAGRKIFYSGDLASVKDLYLFKEDKPEIIITEITHINSKDLYHAFDNLNPKKLYLTHISDEDEKAIQKKNYPKKNIIAVVDGFTIKL